MTTTNNMIGRRELAQQLSTKIADLTEEQAYDLIGTLTELITDNLRGGTAVALTGFGTWKPTMRQATTGVNPQTREKIQIPARRSASFQLGSRLKTALTNT